MEMLNSVCSEENEHEKYHFGFSSSEIIHHLQDKINETINTFITELKSTLTEEYHGKLSNSMQKKIADLENLYRNETTKVLIDFQKDLREILSIPPNAPIYGKISRIYTEEDVDDLKRKFDDAEQKFLQEKKFNEVLKKEMAIIKKCEEWKARTDTFVENITSTKLLSKHSEEMNKLNIDTDIIF